MEPPQQFDQTAYLEVKKILEKNANSFPPNAELALAYIAGGAQLRAAVDKNEFSTCNPSQDCKECWASDHCVHKNMDPRLRVALASALEVLTTPNMTLPDKVVKAVKSYDKTNPLHIAKILRIAAYYQEKLAQKPEEASDDKAQKPSGDSADKDSVSSANKLDGTGSSEPTDRK